MKQGSVLITNFFNSLYLIHRPQSKMAPSITLRDPQPFGANGIPKRKINNLS